MLAEFKMKRARFDENAILLVFSFVLIDIPIPQHHTKLRTLLQNRENYTPLVKNLFVKPAVLKKANIIFGKAAEKKSSQISLSNGTISNKIDKFKIHSFFW